MRAFRLTDFDRAPALADIPLPKPGQGQIRLRIHACGLNFADLLMMKGTYQDTPALPFTLGMEVAGVIDAVGPETQAPAIGTRVTVFGGVGLTAVEIGMRMGARVIACARGSAKLDIARTAGADHLIDSDSGDIRAECKALGGVDVVFDPVGGAQFTAALRACRPDARILTIGYASGEVPQIPANHLLVKNIAVMGLYWGGYLAYRPEIVTSSLVTLLDWYRAGRIAPHVSHRFPLDQAAEALEVLRARKSTGKVVVTVD